MRPLDWIVLVAALVFIVVYGVWKGRGAKDLKGYLLSNRNMKWTTIALSIMATQASAITFLSTPGQAYADGMRFVQFYFGLPIAAVILSVTAIPIYHRLKVYTAYEYLGRRFDVKTVLIQLHARFKQHFDLCCQPRGYVFGFRRRIGIGLAGQCLDPVDLSVDEFADLFTFGRSHRSQSFNGFAETVEDCSLLQAGRFIIGLRLVELEHSANIQQAINPWRFRIDTVTQPFGDIDHRIEHILIDGCFDPFVVPGYRQCRLDVSAGEPL